MKTRLNLQVKILGFVLVLAIQLNPATAQQTFDGGFTFGGNVTQIHGDGFSGRDKIGFNTGVFASYSLSDEMDFKMELKYNQKGSRKNQKPDAGVYDFELRRLNYFDMPLSLQYTFFDKYTAELGAGFGILAGSYFSDNGIEIKLKDSVSYKQADIFALASAGYVINENLHFSLRFAYSIRNISKKSVKGFNFLHLRRYGMYHEVISASIYYTI